MSASVPKICSNPNCRVSLTGANGNYYVLNQAYYCIRCGYARLKQFCPHYYDKQREKELAAMVETRPVQLAFEVAP